MQASGTPVLKVCSLSKTYGKNRALSGIDLEVMPGDTVVVTGPSGCGKSTLLRCIVRLINPDSGRIIVAGEDVTNLSYSDLLNVRRRIGFVFQRSNLIQRLTALENVALPLLAANATRDEAERKAHRALKRVGLIGDVVHRRPCELSGGECQRVAIARALAPEPNLMLWDEPTASLDPILVAEVLDVMESLVKTSEAAMVIVTHEMKFALRAADWLILLNQGKIAEQGTPRKVFDSPESELGVRYSRLLSL
ncbi:MAG TPA: amino acid ABC transporter ATP-binding protein [Bacillota bacterium]|nr:amino acid ABC transporter ATP-binding protein [Bacillota bacterium]